MTKITQLTLAPGNNSGSRQAHSRDGESDAPLQTVGQDLRAARLRRGDAIAVVSRALCIRKDHLEAIEEDRPEHLPGRTYALGFVRSYAGYLGLNAPAYVERYKHENAGRSDGTPQVGFLAESEPLALPYARIMAAALIALVLIYGGYYLFHAAGTHPAPSVAPVPARLTAVSARNVRPLHARMPDPKKPTRLSAGGVTVAGAPGAIPTDSAVDPLLANLPAGQTFGIQNKDVRVVLRARVATHMLVQGPGGRVYLNRILHPGDAYRVPNLVGLLLTTPNGGAVAVELDGQYMGIAGRTGQMTEALSLDPQAIVDRSSAAKRG
ncbi:MAG TPA: helix-turn-helix domain-containing protein [Rhizomicrobium sp.]|jgi:cytoskeleton protein RodZ